MSVISVSLHWTAVLTVPPSLHHTLPSLPSLPACLCSLTHSSGVIIKFELQPFKVLRGRVNLSFISYCCQRENNHLSCLWRDQQKVAVQSNIVMVHRYCNGCPLPLPLSIYKYVPAIDLYICKVSKFNVNK